MTQKSESELLTDERLVMEYGRAPGTGDFYVVTRDGARHEIPDQLARRHFALVDLGLPYPFEDDEDGWAIGTRRGT